MRKRYALIAATVLVAVAGCGGDPRVNQDAPADDALRRLCEQVHHTARDRFAAAGHAEEAPNLLDAVGSDKASVTCDRGAWTFDVDGRDATVEMDMVFNPVADPDDPEDDYCDTAGVKVHLPSDGFEERDFAGHPYCFSWDRSGSAQSAASSYVDRSTEVYLMWNVDYHGDAFAPGSSMSSLLSAANDAVLAAVYEGFGRA